MDLWHINKFYQYLADDLLNQILTSFFRIKSPQLLMLLIFGQFKFCNIIKVNHFFIVSLYHHSKFILFYALDLFLFCMHKFLLNQLTLMVFSVKTLFLFLLNLFCDVKIFVFYKFFVIFYKTFYINIVIV